jgi:hypothetical protein
MYAQDEWQGQTANLEARNTSMSNHYHPWPRQPPVVGKYCIGRAVVAPDS